MCWVSVVSVIGPRRDDQLSLSAPGMWVMWVTSTSAVTKSRVQIMEALVTMEPLDLPVRAHVRAVTLSPLSAMPRPALPRDICPITARMAPTNSHRF